MKKRNLLNGMVISFSLILIGCGESSSTEELINKKPIVNAGKDMSVVINTPITIVGTATDKDGTISTTEWKKGNDTLGTELSLNYIPTKVGTDKLTFIAVDDDGASASDSMMITVKEEKNTPSTEEDEPELPSTGILPMIDNKVIFQKDSQEAKMIKGSVQNLSWAYYTDKKSKRWYISPVKSTGKVVVYSLTDFKDGKNGWGTVGENVASFNLQNETVSIGYIADNPEHRYYDAGWKEWNVDAKIQKDIEYIRNSTVNIKWWFFQASNGSWYIINKNGDTWKFSSKVENRKTEYDWINVGMGGAKPNFFTDNGVKKLRFPYTGIISTYYDSSSRIVYVLASNGVANPKVYFAGRNAITGNCLGDNAEVHMMNFQSITDVKTNVKAGLEAGAKQKGISVKLSTEGSSSASYQTPSVYYYDFDSLVTEQLHYNIVAEQSGNVYSSGWLPDNGGGCTYTPNPLK